MKAKVIFTIIGFAALMACKKEKIEIVKPNEKSDTVVTKPPYWCLKSAVLKRYGFPDRHVYFEYNSNSQIISVKEYAVGLSATESLWQDTILTAYTYKDDKLVYKKMVKSNGEKCEEFITYENGKIKKKEITGRIYYFFDVFEPTLTTYEYADNTISTTTSYPYYVNANGVDEIQTGTVTTTFKDYPDSSVAETNHYRALIYLKEKLYKKDRKITIYEPPTKWGSSNPELIVNNSDSINLSLKENRFNPIVWDYLNIYFHYDAMSNYHIYPVLLDHSHNKSFVDSRGLKNKLIYNNLYDAENRLVNIKLQSSDYEVTFTY